jgi:hypothetical protein
MASLLLAVFSCAYSNIVARKHEKEQQKVQQHYLQDNVHTASGTNSSVQQSKDKKKGETLRAKAARKLRGDKGGNPSPLGDPISVKAETSERLPTDGARVSTSGTTLRVTEEGNEASRSSRSTQL